MDLSTTTLILTGLVTIIFLVTVILSFKTWKVYTILLVLLNFMAAVCFFYYAARTLKTHKEWRKTAAVYEAGLERLKKENRELVEGKRDKDNKLVVAGIEWNNRWLHHLSLVRGRVWEGCQPGTVDAATGAVSVTVPAGGDHIEIDSQAGKAEVVYVFEETAFEDGGRYLGEFNVLNKTGGGDEAVVFKLVPTHKVRGVELTRITDKKKLWSIHAVMPRDNHRAFHKLSLEDGKAKFTVIDKDKLMAFVPKKMAGENDADYQKFVVAWIDEYSRDMQAASPDDPPARKWVKVSFNDDYKMERNLSLKSLQILPLIPAGAVEFELGMDYGHGDKYQTILDYKTFHEMDPDVVSQKGELYVRELRNYVHLFDDCERQRAAIAADIIDIQRERTFVLTSQVNVLAREAMRVRERDLLKIDAANFVIERDGVEKYRKLLLRHSNDVMAEVERLHFENQKMAKELAQLQLAAKRRLEAKTPAKSTSLLKNAGPGL
jgi:hypothetical protein